MSPPKDKAAQTSSSPRSSDRPISASPNPGLNGSYHPQGENHAGEALRPAESPDDLPAPQPAFRPFFTLVEDATSSEHYHPVVHYIFSDDDTDIITEAALRSLEPGYQSQSGEENIPSQKGKKKKKKQASSRNRPRHSQTYSLPPAINNSQEHYILLDVQLTEPDAPVLSDNPPTGAQEPPRSRPTTANPARPIPSFQVTSAQSLSPSWQVLDASLEQAPAFDSSNSPSSATQDSPVGGLMLKIQGTSGFRPETHAGKKNQARNQRQTIEEMMDRFSKQMRELEKFVEASGNYPAAQEQEIEGNLDGPRE
ncbi:hypothetical protein FQN57_002614 [Myotisia sp. PD_48]|nr:hypothetical protein FQN57_002614 [Myotisia sp. PD_48]